MRRRKLTSEGGKPSLAKSPALSHPPVMSDRPSLKSMIKPRFRGTLVGGALGDALGFPYEGSSRSYMVALGQKLVEGFERHRSGYFPAGQFSDDTQMTLATVEAILTARDLDGATVAEAFIPLWRENRIVGRSEVCTEAIQRLIDGSADWTRSGAEPGHADSSAAMRAAPIGLWDYDNQELIAEHAALIGGITQRDTRAQAGAAAVAAAVAYNMTHREVILGDFVDLVADTSGALDPGFAHHVRELPRLLALPEAAAIEQISVLGLEDPPLEAREGIPVAVVPTVTMALYGFLRSPSEYLSAVHRCLLAGGNVDSTASIVGAISGAMNGIDELPDTLVLALPRAGTILHLADALYALKDEQRARAM